MQDRERYILTIAGGFILGVLATLGAEALYFRQSIDWSATFQSVQNIAQTLAFLFAGIWTYRLFIRQRMDRKRANITLEVTHVKLNEEYRLLRVVVQIQNVGNVEICPLSGEISVHKIVPIDEKELAKFTSSPACVELPTPEKHWPIEQKCSLNFKGDNFTLEPNEFERYSRDFILASTIKVVQVHSAVRMHDEGEYWDETSVISLTDK